MSKSCEGRSNGEPSGHAHPHLQAMGSDNGLDRIDWDFHPVPQPIDWDLLSKSQKKRADEVRFPFFFLS